MSTDNVKPSADAQGTETVFIGCRIPNGLILEIGRKGDDEYVVLELKGPHAFDTVQGVGITEVPKAHWEGWLGVKGNSELNPRLRGTLVNKNLPFIRNRQVFECRSAVDAQAVGIELMGTKTGFEPLDPDRQPAGLEVVDAKTTNQMRRANKGANRTPMGQRPPVARSA